jgi:secondary thiamine-phosphate synthase enzyme
MTVARMAHQQNSYREVLRITTSRRTQLVDITAEVRKAVQASGVAHGRCYLYVPHTTAGVIINEHDDPDVARDIETAFDRLAPRTEGYRHAEGNADSHIKAAFAGNCATVFVDAGKLELGRWQGIFFCEFDGPRTRALHLRVVAD